jgi:hypothetical protein
MQLHLLSVVDQEDALLRPKLAVVDTRSGLDRFLTIIQQVIAQSYHNLQPSLGGSGPTGLRIPHFRDSGVLMDSVFPLPLSSGKRNSLQLLFDPST